MNARDLYQSTIMEHARAPRRAAMPASVQAPVRRHNPLCGDRVDVGVVIEGGAIADIGVAVRGCALCVAAGSMMAERAIGADRAAVDGLAAAVESLLEGEATGAELGDLEVFEVVRRFPSRKRCVTLPFEALKEAVTA